MSYDHPKFACPRAFPCRLLVARERRTNAGRVRDSCWRGTQEEKNTEFGLQIAQVPSANMLT